MKNIQPKKKFIRVYLSQADDNCQEAKSQQIEKIGGVLFWQGSLHFSSKDSTTMIFYSSSCPEPFKAFALFAASLKKPLFLD